ncbi:transposable element Tcb2 transposase [Trichonephila clavipes]|nr:transposable element Tcb2 transposase [Trichonephila clavipes]
MTVPVVQSVNGLSNAHFSVRVSGTFDSVIAQCLPGQEGTETGVSPELNPIEPLWDVLEQGVKGHHTALTNLTELWTALANIWQVIPVEHFQKLVESVPRRVAAIIKARGGLTHYKVDIPNSVALQYVVALAASIMELTKASRQARTSMWCALITTILFNVDPDIASAHSLPPDFQENEENGASGKH